jgi:hypothetical protein
LQFDGSNLYTQTVRSYNASANISYVIGGTNNGYVDNLKAAYYRLYVSGNAGGQSLDFQAYIQASGYASRMIIGPTGGVSIGNTTDPGATNLSVTGNGKFGTTVGVGAATPSTSGAGITFPATQSNSSNVNTLDDYEEGTYTPADNSGASLTLTGLVGNYTKIGRLVYFSLQCTYPVTTSTAVAVITVPFPIALSSGVSIGYTDYIAANQLYATASASRSGIRFLNVATELTNVNISGKTFVVSGTYQTDT